VLAEKLPPKPACGRDYSHAMEALLAYIYCKTYPLHRVCLWELPPCFLPRKSNATIAGACLVVSPEKKARSAEGIQ